MVPTPSPAAIEAFVLGFLAGMTVPTYYGLERLAGFGRAVAKRLPYEPPPGQDPEEAMREAQPDGEGRDET